MSKNFIEWKNTFENEIDNFDDLVSCLKALKSRCRVEFDLKLLRQEFDKDIVETYPYLARLEEDLEMREFEAELASQPQKKNTFRKPTLNTPAPEPAKAETLIPPRPQKQETIIPPPRKESVFSPKNETIFASKPVEVEEPQKDENSTTEVKTMLLTNNYKGEIIKRNGLYFGKVLSPMGEEVISEKEFLEKYPEGFRTLNATYTALEKMNIEANNFTKRTI